MRFFRVVVVDPKVQGRGVADRAVEVDGMCAGSDATVVWNAIVVAVAAQRKIYAIG